MKFDLNCVRQILLTIEAQDAPLRMFPQKFCELIPDYDDKEIEYCCRRLNEANFLNLFFFQSCGKPEDEIQLICDLTFQGHQFLESIRDNSNWNKILEACKKVGAFSIPIVSQIAVKVAQANINTLFT